VGTVDDYLSTLGPQEAAAVGHVLDLVREVVPEVEQGTSYGMPAYTYRGRPLAAAIAARSHLSLFPFSAAVVAAVQPRLEGYSVSKGTLRFTLEKPLPDDVVRDAVAARRAEIDASR
jgi:uncharacterized protein YdhG (YjbR/CyaY superfamily)